MNWGGAGLIVLVFGVGVLFCLLSLLFPSFFVFILFISPLFLFSFPFPFPFPSLSSLPSLSRGCVSVVWRGGGSGESLMPKKQSPSLNARVGLSPEDLRMYVTYFGEWGVGMNISKPAIGGGSLFELSHGSWSSTMR